MKHYVITAHIGARITVHKILICEKRKDAVAYVHSLKGKKGYYTYNLHPLVPTDVVDLTANKG